MRMNNLAYIPARGGSKGLPRKNIRLLAGHPLIAYTIKAAQKSNLFDKVMVSTDDKEIADIAESYGAWVPFLRDSRVSGDRASSIEAICSDRERLINAGYEFSSLCMLQPTSPLRTADEIRNAYELFDRKKGGVVSLSPTEETPYLMRTVNDEGEVEHVLSIRGAIRRQDLPRFYKLNGAIYINAWSELSLDLTQADNPYGYIMSSEASVDIDTEEDLKTVEAIILNKGAQYDIG